MAETHIVEGEISLNEAARLLQSASRDLQNEFGRNNGSGNSLSGVDEGFASLINSPAPFALIHSLNKNGIDTISVDRFDSSNSRQAIGSIMRAGDQALRENDIPAPDISYYNMASEISDATNRPILEVLEIMETKEPLSMRADFKPEGRSFSIETSDTVSAGLDNDKGPLAASVEAQSDQSLGDDFKSIDYREYDVHLLARPIWENDAGWLATRDSHAFVVITEKGGNPYNPDEALLVTRAGPDHGWSISGGDTKNEQSPTDKGYDGDVYVAYNDESKRIDYYKHFDDKFPENNIPYHNLFSLESATISIKGDIDDLKDQVNDFREFINSQDIDYKLIHQNSNTYAGDVYELLTGNEPYNPHSGLFGRRTPALDNDLVDYEETDYANYFD